MGDTLGVLQIMEEMPFNPLSSRHRTECPSTVLKPLESDLNSQNESGIGTSDTLSSPLVPASDTSTSDHSHLSTIIQPALLPSPSSHSPPILPHSPEDTETIESNIEILTTPIDCDFHQPHPYNDSSNALYTSTLSDNSNKEFSLCFEHDTDSSYLTEQCNNSYNEESMLDCNDEEEGEGLVKEQEEGEGLVMEQEEGEELVMEVSCSKDNIVSSKDSISGISGCVLAPPIDVAAVLKKSVSPQITLVRSPYKMKPVDTAVMTPPSSKDKPTTTSGRKGNKKVGKRERFTQIEGTRGLRQSVRTRSRTSLQDKAELAGVSTTATKTPTREIKTRSSRDNSGKDDSMTDDNTSVSSNLMSTDTITRKTRSAGNDSESAILTKEPLLGRRRSLRKQNEGRQLQSNETGSNGGIQEQQTMGDDTSDKVSPTKRKRSKDGSNGEERKEFKRPRKAHTQGYLNKSDGNDNQSKQGGNGNSSEGGNVGNGASAGAGNGQQGDKASSGKTRGGTGRGKASLRRSSGDGSGGSSRSSNGGSPNSNKKWKCEFCGYGNCFKNLGYLYGPYPVKEVRDEDSSTTPLASSSVSTREGEKNKQANSDERNVWVHVPCVYWSPGVCLVGDKITGIEEAVSTGNKTTCCVCGNNGAVLCCHIRSCRKCYHYPCAIEKECVFDEERFTITCSHHKPHGASPPLQPSSNQSVGVAGTPSVPQGLTTFNQSPMNTSEATPTKTNGVL